MVEKNAKGFYPSDIYLPGAVVSLETDGQPPLVCRAGEGDDCPAQQFRDATFMQQVGELLLEAASRAK